MICPALEADVPKGECLQGRGLTGVVGSDEGDGAAEFDVDLSEAFEIADGELGQHRTAYASSMGVEGYVATLRLTPVTDGDRTFWRWWSEFDTPRGQEGKLRTLVGEDIYMRGFAAIRRQIAA